MSTVKTNNVQIGQSATATNNFTWYQPASPDGTVRLGNGNSGSVTDAVTVTSAGYVGFGTTSPANNIFLSGADNPIFAISSRATGKWKSEFHFKNNNTLKWAIGVDPINNGTNGFFFYDAAAASYRAVIASDGVLLLGTEGNYIGTGIFQLRGGMIGDNSSVDGNFTLRARSGTIYSDSIYNSTTATGASVTITGTAGYLQRTVSAAKYKTDIEDIDLSLTSKLFDLRPVWYRSICASDRKDWSYYGFIAEEVAEVEPRLVHWGEPDENGVQEPEGVMYERITVLLMAELKKMKDQLDGALTRIAELEAK